VHELVVIGHDEGIPAALDPFWHARWRLRIIEMADKDQLPPAQVRPGRLRP
jgi:hypothetical protein